jgi:hypothetical protein
MDEDDVDLRVVVPSTCGVSNVTLAIKSLVGSEGLGYLNSTNGVYLQSTKFIIPRKRLNVLLRSMSRPYGEMWPRAVVWNWVATLEVPSRLRSQYRLKQMFFEFRFFNLSLSCHQRTTTRNRNHIGRLRSSTRSERL